MKYYEMHEVMYQKIKDEGQLSWDKSISFDEMWSHSTNVYLKKFLTKENIGFSGLKVLDLGTGTGTSALYCSKEGAQSVGIEFSKTAIQIARNNALNLKLSTEFIQGDVLELKLDKKFDLIIDSTVLHCIVGSEDRTKFYDSVKRHIDKDGFLFFNTMISTGNMTSCFPKEHFHFEDEILWSLGISEIEKRKIINGKSYFPHRTLLSEEKQMEEFRSNGFEIIESEIAFGDKVHCLVGLLRLLS